MSTLLAQATVSIKPHASEMNTSPHMVSNNLLFQYTNVTTNWVVASLSSVLGKVFVD